jgi:hypothetical protein
LHFPAIQLALIDQSSLYAEQMMIENNSPTIKIREHVSLASLPLLTKWGEALAHPLHPREVEGELD